MNGSYSKIRHIQEANKRLENRLLMGVLRGPIVEQVQTTNVKEVYVTKSDYDYNVKNVDGNYIIYKFNVINPAISNDTSIETDNPCVQVQYANSGILNNNSFTPVEIDEIKFKSEEAKTINTELKTKLLGSKFFCKGKGSSSTLGYSYTTDGKNLIARNLAYLNPGPFLNTNPIGGTPNPVVSNPQNQVKLKKEYIGTATGGDPFDYYKIIDENNIETYYYKCVKEKCKTIGKSIPNWVLAKKHNIDAIKTAETTGSIKFVEK